MTREKTASKGLAVMRKDEKFTVQGEEKEFVRYSGLEKKKKGREGRAMRTKPRKRPQWRSATWKEP
jgi:hypothetical protein